METLMRANAKAGTVGALLIAAGTDWQIVVRDARQIMHWATPTAMRINEGGKLIVYHHTAGGVGAKRSARYELNLLIQMAHEAPYGLPYNFVVMPAPPFRVWYLNDLDRAWPHTYGYNWSTAIAAYGNYSEDQPDPRMVARMLRLADALASMWGEQVPEVQHRDVVATECPGNNLAPLLPAHGRQRDA
jgi:hypothetical protein